MENYTAFVYVEPDLNLPNPAEIESFVWAGCVTADSQIGYLRQSFINDLSYFDKDGGNLTIEVFKELRTKVVIKANREFILARAAYFLALMTNGAIEWNAPNGKTKNLDDLIPLFGTELDFDFEESLTRILDDRQRLPPYFEKHMPFLSKHITEDLTQFRMQGAASTLVGGYTHPLIIVKDWIYRSDEGFTRFAFDRLIPDNYVACLNSVYTWQEWIFVLWKRDSRRFWFTAPVFHLYDSDDSSDMRSPAKAAESLQNALKIWDEEDSDVYIVEKDRRIPKNDAYTEISLI